jgi:hypothetical protein
LSLAALLTIAETGCLIAKMPDVHNEYKNDTTTTQTPKNTTSNNTTSAPNKTYYELYLLGIIVVSGNGRKNFPKFSFLFIAIRRTNVCFYNCFRARQEQQQLDSK